MLEPLTLLDVVQRDVLAMSNVEGSPDESE